MGFDPFNVPPEMADAMAVWMIHQSKAHNFDLTDLLHVCTRFDGVRAVYRLGFTIDTTPNERVDVSALGVMFVGVN